MDLATLLDSDLAVLEQELSLAVMIFTDRSRRVWRKSLNSILNRHKILSPIAQGS